LCVSPQNNQPTNHCTAATHLQTRVYASRNGVCVIYNIYIMEVTYILEIFASVSLCCAYIILLSIRKRCCFVVAGVPICSELSRTPTLLRATATSAYINKTYFPFLFGAGDRDLLFYSRFYLCYTTSEWGLTGILLLCFSLEYDINIISIMQHVIRI
jgi:hypothetical protein